MIRVGCCGFPTSRDTYIKNFNMVELNSTFYKYPNDKTVKKWRSEVPAEFEFTVKAHQDITHKFRFDLEASIEPFERMKKICKGLESAILVFQTPASFKPEFLEQATRFFGAVNREELILAWETRGPSWESREASESLKASLEVLEVAHVTDPFKVMPVYVGRTAYFRLHGLGKDLYYYQYTDRELIRLHDLIKPFSIKCKQVYVLFNNLSMFEDAKRFQSLLREGKVPPLSKKKGLEAAKEILVRASFPTTKGTLMRKVGWRVIETEDNIQVRLAEIMEKISPRTYKSADDLISELEKKL
ncbi:MAG: DUF72 domain-containing protein [Nitrososphaerota archaeon]|nr:DUF72 domain-containing protein [Candidatus Bathyarchaeota archaeon]MDW8049094.1 DUF72 domain-containing protein [Nitrososphaerota archaeon]